MDEEAFFYVLNEPHSRTGFTNVALAGCAMNSVARLVSGGGFCKIAPDALTVFSVAS